jgi:hypothetical protein
MENPHSDQAITFAKTKKIIEQYPASQKDVLGSLIVQIKKELVGIQKSILQEDDDFNQALIKALSEKFKRDPLEVALLLNTPALQRTPAVKQWIEAHKQDPTYFSLLPADVIKILTQFKIGDTSFEQLDNAITQIKLFAQKNPENHRKLLFDTNYNAELIVKLAKTFNRGPAEVALLLHTPASLALLHNKTLPLPGKIELDVADDMKWYLRTLLGAETESEREKNKQIAIKYIKRFLQYPDYFPQTYQYPDAWPEEQRWPLFIDSIGRGASVPYDSSNPPVQPSIDRTQEYASRLRDQLRIYILLDSPVMQKEAENLAIQENLKHWLFEFLLQDLQTAFAKRDTKSIHFILSFFVSRNKYAYKHPYGWQSRKEASGTDIAKIRKFFKDRFGARWYIYWKDRNEKFPVSYFMDYQTFMKDILSYVQETKDYNVLQKLQIIMPEEDFAQLAIPVFLDIAASDNPDYKILEGLQSFVKDIINQPSQDGLYPLIKAIQSKKPGMVRIVLGVPGMNVNTCQKGHNALWYVRNLETDAATRLAIIELLQQAGATEEGVCAVQ